NISRSQHVLGEIPFALLPASIANLVFHIVVHFLAQATHYDQPHNASLPNGVADISSSSVDPETCADLEFYGWFSGLVRLSRTDTALGCASSGSRRPAPIDTS